MGAVEPLRHPCTCLVGGTRVVGKVPPPLWRRFLGAVRLGGALAPCYAHAMHAMQA